MADGGQTEQIGTPPSRGPGGRGGQREVSGGTIVLDPALIVSALVGIYLLVTGIVAVARTDFAQAGLFDPQIVVGGLPHTPLLGFIEIIFGLLVLAGGTVVRDGTAVTFFGVVALVIGLVWIIEPTSFTPYVGVDRGNGVQHVIIGLVLVISGQITPFTIERPSGG